MKRPGLAVVFSSPSGTGKTTICHQLIKKSKEFQFSISGTTRKPRGKEKHGQDYFFFTKSRFEKAKKAGHFIETARYLDCWYGTPIKPLKDAVDNGKIVLLDIDVQGGNSIKRRLPDAVSIFLLPPSITELKRRLKNRLTETAELQKQRLEAAAGELTYWEKYDYVVINDNLKTAVEEVYQIISSERRKPKRLKNTKFWKKSLHKLLGLGGTRR